jgi:hypothetical protein
MGRHRRKRGINVCREPTGRLQRERDEEIAPAKLRRLFVAALTRMEDPRWASELGRLYRLGKISGSLYTAGERYLEIVRHYRATIGAAQPPRSPLRDRVASSRHADEPGQWDEAAARAFRDGNEVLHNCGSFRIVTQVVVDDQMAAPFELDQLIIGLAALALHFGLHVNEPNGKLVRSRSGSRLIRP